MARTWKYEAIVDRIVDGDTIVCDIDQGMNHWMRGQYVRLAGINAPERSTDAGQAAKAFIEGLLRPGDEVFLVTTEYHEFEKYGRVLAYVYKADPSAGEVSVELSVNTEMVDSGNAVVYNP